MSVVAVCAVTSACDKAEMPEKGPRTVVVEHPRPLDGAGGLESYPGTLRAREEADLSFRVPGKIAKRNVELGSRVKQGDVIAVLDPEDAKLNLSAAGAALSAAEADLRLAAAEEQRYQDLHKKGHVGQSAVDIRMNTRRAAQARVKQSRSQLELAENQSRYTTLRADSTGVITQIFAEAGNVVSAGQPVVHFAADGEREVQIAIPEGRVDALRQASQLVIEIYSMPGKTFPAKIRDITPQADKVTRTFEGRITLLAEGIDAPLGATANVMAVSASDGKTFRLPATALGALDEDKPVVWKLRTSEDTSKEFLAEAVTVQVLQYMEDSVIVSGDIAAQDRLITAGVHRLRAGMRVLPLERSAPAAL